MIAFELLLRFYCMQANVFSLHFIINAMMTYICCITADIAVY